MTLDADGIPYGPGKREWLAEINKLAVGLDPSCTHIRKQTYEDMCIFKDRLHQHFEYSGDLNEDHVRALLGKAVTRKRTELVALITRGGTQPLHIDEEVWERLRRLANSKQRESKTEHGRYVNACRRMFGRTCSLGVAGIREKLHERYGRSLDPDEVREEMERHKSIRGEDDGKFKKSRNPLQGVEIEVHSEDPTCIGFESGGSEEYGSD